MASTNVRNVLRSLGDSGNYNTIERVPTPYLPNQPLKILVQNFSQVPRCKVFFQSMQHRAVSHQQLLPLRKHSKKSQASFTNQECLSSQPPEEQDDSQIEAGFTIRPTASSLGQTTQQTSFLTQPHHLICQTPQAVEEQDDSQTEAGFTITPLDSSSFRKIQKKFSQLRHTN